MSKIIQSIIALSGDRAAAVAVAARDLHAAIYHLCHAGQATPLADTVSGLPNRGRAAKVKAVVGDFWQAAAQWRADAKAQGKLDKSGRYVGLKADDVPFTLGAIADAFNAALAPVKRAAKADSAADGEGKVEAETEAMAARDEKSVAVTVAVESATADLTAQNVALEAENAALRAENETLKAENESLKAELFAALERVAQYESALEDAGFDVVAVAT